MNILFKRYFFGFVVLLIYCSSLFGTTIVVLQGASCAGKTSICNELVRLNTSWKMVEEDTVVFERNRQLWSDLYPEEYAIIQRSVPVHGIYPAVLRNKFFFKDGTEQRDKDHIVQSAVAIQCGMRKKITKNPALVIELKKQIRKRLVKTIKDLVLQGSNVIVDSWVLEKEDCEELKVAAPMLYGLVYCPLPEMVNRIAKRNSESIVKNHYDSIRIFRNPLYSFFIHYEIKKDPTLPILVIDKISKPTVSVLIEKVRNNMIAGPHNSLGDPFVRDEISYLELEDYKNSLLNKLGGDGLGYITSKTHHDILLCTDNFSSQECAQKLLDYASKKGATTGIKSKL